MPSQSPPCCTKHLPEPTAMKEPLREEAIEPIIALQSEPIIVSDQVCEPATPHIPERILVVWMRGLGHCFSVWRVFVYLSDSLRPLSVPLCPLLSVVGHHLGPAGNHQLMELRSPWLCLQPRMAQLYLVSHHPDSCACTPPSHDSGIVHRPFGLTELPRSVG